MIYEIVVCLNSPRILRIVVKLEERRSDTMRQHHQVQEQILGN